MFFSRVQWITPSRNLVKNIKAEVKHGIGERKISGISINCITNNCTNVHNRSENTSIYLLIFWPKKDWWILQYDREHHEHDTIFLLSGAICFMVSDCKKKNCIRWLFSPDNRLKAVSYHQSTFSSVYSSRAVAIRDEKCGTLKPFLGPLLPQLLQSCEWPCWVFFLSSLGSLGMWVPLNLALT